MRLLLVLRVHVASAFVEFVDKLRFSTKTAAMQWRRWLVGPLLPFVLLLVALLVATWQNKKCSVPVFAGWCGPLGSDFCFRT